MDTKYKLLLIFLFIIVISAFIYNYTCNKKLLTPISTFPENENSPYDKCLTKMLNGKICPDCITPINNTTELDKCPTSFTIDFCKI
jgi:hypothetical protein